MAGLLAAHGFTTVYCTPHQIRGCFEAGNDRVRQGITALQQLITESGIVLNLKAGREYILDENLLTALEDPLPLGDSRLILIEIPARLSDAMVRQLLYAVVRAGFTPVIAHPERCPLLVPPRQNSEKPGIFGAMSRFLSGGRRSETAPDGGDSGGNPLLEYLRDLGCSFQGILVRYSDNFVVMIKVVVIGIMMLPLALSPDDIRLFSSIPLALMLMLTGLYMVAPKCNHIIMQAFYYSAGTLIIFMIANLGRDEVYLGIDLLDYSYGFFTLLLLCVGFKVLIRKRMLKLVVSPFEYLVLLIVLSIPLLPAAFTASYHLLTVAAESVILFVAFKIIIRKEALKNRYVILALMITTVGLSARYLLGV